MVTFIHKISIHSESSEQAAVSLSALEKTMATWSSAMATEPIESGLDYFAQSHSSATGSAKT